MGRLRAATVASGLELRPYSAAVDEGDSSSSSVADRKIMLKSTKPYVPAGSAVRAPALEFQNLSWASIGLLVVALGVGRSAVGGFTAPKSEFWLGVR